MCQELQYPVPEPWGIIILLSNIFFPCLGTLIAAYCKHDGFSCGNFWLGWVQSLCCVLIFGWCWAIWHGYKIYENSKRHNATDVHVTAQYNPNGQPQMYTAAPQTYGQH